VKVRGFDGREHSFPKKHKLKKEQKNASKLHIRTRKILRITFPLDILLEEIVLPGTGGLRADFYIPDRKIVVECHGRQHYEFVAHFHGNKLGFFEYTHNDRKKIEWCVMNKIRIVELPYDESDEQWKQRIKG
jgi:hypothetical protein|tara:strand:+ start:786 stop:1181 length:396 start_codon:yes stop_codon:yes gene_type:complete